MRTGWRFNLTWAARCLMGLIGLLGILAIYYSTLQPNWLRIAVAIVFGLFVEAAAFAACFRRPALVWAGVMAAFSIWYLTDHPSAHRDWAAEYAVPATMDLANRNLTVRHIRNFTYRSEADIEPAYYDASFSLDDLNSVDLVTSYWAGEAIAHVFLTFGFRDGRYLAFSIETRRRKDDGYSSLAGFFHRYELYYVVADERDVIGVRTDVRHERVYLYRLHLSSHVREQLFLSYVNKVNALAAQPEWYNTLTDNCTTGIMGRARAGALEVAYNWRVLLSGHAAEYAYRLGLLSKASGFPELKRESRITRGKDAVLDKSFSNEIRQGLPL